MGLTASPSPHGQDEYPDVFRFTASVFPSEDDDVITSPYNAMLSLSKAGPHLLALPETAGTLIICWFSFLANFAPPLPMALLS